MIFHKKYIVIILANLLVCKDVFSCDLSAYLSKTESYELFKLEQKESRLKNKSIASSFFPNVSIGMGQYINNNTGLVDIGRSSFYISASQLIFSGESLGKNSEKEENENKRRIILYEKDVNEQLLKLYADILQYKYLKDNISLLSRKLSKLKLEYNKTLLDFKSGIVPSLEVDVNSLNVQKMESSLNGLQADYELLENKINKNYSIPPEKISKITEEEILSCKKYSYQELVDKNKHLKLQQADIELDINNASLLPSVYLSIGLTPKNEGVIRDLNLRKMNYNGGINITFPISNIFSAIDNQKKYAISVTKARLQSEREQEELLITNRNILNDYLAIKRNIPILKKEVQLKNRRMEYKLWLVKEKKGDVLSYLDSQDELYEAEINLKKNERDLKYYQMYLSFI
ncbi:TPA: TolC family protein, partial [Yersinia enterocolitica]|nr:TolC family protein [Yersinia enterocolitica]